MKEFIKALVSKNKSNIVPAEHNLFGHFVGEWDFEWIDCYGTAEERHIKESGFSVDIGRNGYSRRFYLSFT